jgi:dTDP-4-dehydrorhamnose 3,5-epimerase
MYELTGADLGCLTFPSGILHGWYFHTDALHLQAVSESYAQYADDDNWGCIWSDPALEIPWPFGGQPIVARRAAEFPPLGTLLAQLKDWTGSGAD